MVPESHYTLRTGIADGRMVFIGVGGAIDGQVNPTPSATVGETVQVTLLKRRRRQTRYCLSCPEYALGARHPPRRQRHDRLHSSGGGRVSILLRSAGHREAGMEGRFVVSRQPPPTALLQADISHDPANVPPPVGSRPPQTVRVDLESIEQQARLADGTSSTFWTFKGTMPGPFVRVRVGDMVEVHMRNAANSAMYHSVDFHGATGPGGGSAGLQVAPGQEKVLTFKALVPGV